MEINGVPIDQYFWNHSYDILGLLMGVMIAIRQHFGQKHAKESVTQIHVTVEEVRRDLQNGVGTRIANTAICAIVPVLEEKAKVAAAKIEQKADEVAADLEHKTAWDGVERRSSER